MDKSDALMRRDLCGPPPLASLGCDCRVSSAKRRRGTSSKRTGSASKDRCAEGAGSLGVTSLAARNIGTGARL